MFAQFKNPFISKVFKGKKTIFANIYTGPLQLLPQKQLTIHSIVLSNLSFAFPKFAPSIYLITVGKLENNFNCYNNFKLSSPQSTN